MIDAELDTLIGDGVEGSEQRLQMLLDTLPHIAFAIFTGGSAEYYNQAFLDYHGFRPGPDKASRTALLHPQDRPRLEAERQAAAAADREYIVEARLLRHDGAHRWHRIHNKPIMRSGKRIGWIGSAVDIHEVREANEALEQRVAERTAELRASEARYRALYHRTPMALHSVDAGARLIDVNDTWVDLFDCTRQEALGRSPSEFMTPESAMRYNERAWPEFLANSGRARAAEYQFVTRGGRIFDGRLASRGEFDAQGRFVRSWSAIADITAEKRAEHDLRQAQRMEAIGQLTAGIAHDFNNLMTVILGNLELLQRRVGTEPRAERLIEGARTAAGRGARLTAQLLAFSRQQRIAAEPVALNALLEGMRPLLTSTIGANIGIELQLAPLLGAAQADPTQLELAVLNLAINARDAMQGGGTIAITTAPAKRGPPLEPEEPQAGDYVSLSVTDTGTGIPDAVRVDPFFTTKEIGKGSGLGLSQVLGVMKQLGGGISVHSAPGEGTTFTLYLPQAGQSVAPDRLPALPADRPAATRTLAVMVVDDDPAVRRVTADMLRAAEHDVLELGSGEEALTCLQQARPDVLVADVAMPGMNGVELAAAARRHWPGLPVLFMTGYAEERLLPPGAEEQVLRKPFHAAELEARVAAVAASGQTTKPAAAARPGTS